MIMARKKYGFDNSALEKYGERLDELGGTDALKRATQAGMAAAKAETNKRIKAAMQPGNLPAGGKYSTGATLAALNEQMAVSWSGNKAELPLGFDLDNGGLASIFLMTGTPRMQPATWLWDAFYGKDTARVVKKEMEKATVKVLERLGG